MHISPITTGPSPTGHPSRFSAALTEPPFTPKLETTALNRPSLVRQFFSLPAKAGRMAAKTPRGVKNAFASFFKSEEFKYFGKIYSTGVVFGTGIITAGKIWSLPFLNAVKEGIFSVF